MTCRELAGVLLEYLTGEMPEEAAANLAAHLAACPDCAVFVAQYERTIALGHATTGEAIEVDEQFVKLIVTSIKAG